ncbi:MAG: cytochrome c [Verrucomicrobiales bacterium]|nr:cytochrome c [Verrucomicrobiales bacterium]
MGSSICLAEPVIPGLHGKHPLDEAQQGQLLIRELRCAACHEGFDSLHMKSAPNFSDIGSRLTSDFLERFIADPAAVHPGTTMPDLLGSVSKEEREQIAKALAAFLGTLEKKEGNAESLEEGDADAGRTLFHEVGCVACHSPRDENGSEIQGDMALSLAHVKGKFQPGELAAFLLEPLKTRPSGRMPDMKLTREEAAALAKFLEGEAAPADEAKKPDADLIAEGKQAFSQFHCASCHEADGVEHSADFPGPPKGKFDLEAGCLSPDSGAAPDFDLSDSQRDAIRSALRVADPEAAEAAEIDLRLTQLNCIACHVRDDFGGVAENVDPFFRSTEEGLGNESRIPPPLTLVGAKLKPEWLNGVLHDSLTVRPYMKTRMPGYGDSALTGLPELFAKTDHLDPVELPEPDRENRPMVRNGAHLLMGDKGLNCIACHNHNGKESPGLKGLDLMTSFQRLQPAWFSNYMKNPAAFRPGIVMPNYFPDGKAVQTDILEGDADRQLAALWHYFSLGRSARDPSGLRSEPSKLVVKDKPRTYRGRSRVAGYRGIAVGFPGGLNYAFNAQNGALSAIWTGEFVSVGWQGQGSGNFNPIGRPVQFAQDVAFVKLQNESASWPLRSQTSKEKPINPDPLYPKNHGYAFLGYSVDEADVPTFRYRCGEVEIEDRSDADGKILVRKIRFSAPEAETIWFRPLTGKIETESETVFKTPELKISLEPKKKTILRPIGDGEQELLIELPLVEGESNFTIRYELRR